MRSEKNKRITHKGRGLPHRIFHKTRKNDGRDKIRPEMPLIGVTAARIA